MKNASFRKQLSSCQGMGIDVSKAELVIGGLTADEPILKRISNQRSSVRAFVRAIRDSDYRGKVFSTHSAPCCCESLITVVWILPAG